MSLTLIPLAVSAEISLISLETRDRSMAKHARAQKQTLDATARAYAKWCSNHPGAARRRCVVPAASSWRCRSKGALLPPLGLVSDCVLAFQGSRGGSQHSSTALVTAAPPSARSRRRAIAEGERERETHQIG